MKQIFTTALLITAVTSGVLAQDLESKTDSISYMLGADLAKNLSQQGMELNADYVYQGMKDVFEGTGSVFDQATSQQLMTAFQTEMRNAQMAAQQQAAADNEAKGQAFLSENATKEGVQTTESGLQYLVLEEGEGSRPTDTSMVEVHYEGKLLNGDVFDSSYQRGTPVTFPLNRVIAGWTEGVQLMPVGSKYRLFVPGNLAYGPQGSPPKIGPNETLIFEVELISIK